MHEFFGTQFQLTPPTWFLLSRRWGCFSCVLLLQMSLSGAMQVMLVGWRSKPSLRLRQRAIHDGTIASNFERQDYE